MSSQLGWLDHDDAQRAAMMEMVKLFQDQGSVDELGVGSVRDAFSDAFFPGTSVLHNRVRYLLFVPWLFADVARKGRPVDGSRQALKDAEVSLIRALLEGGEKARVIGSRAQGDLKTMPSQVYWPALGWLQPGKAERACKNRRSEGVRGALLRVPCCPFEGGCGGRSLQRNEAKGRPSNVA